MKLQQLQQHFLHYLNDAPNSLPDLVTASAGVSVERRLHIYHHAYRARLVEVMQDIFERVWAYLGDDGFADTARAYIGAYPPRGRTLSGFGADFPAWLLTHFSGDGEIADVAKIDWLLRVAFDGADGVALPIRSLSTLAALQPRDWGAVHFRFHPTVTLSSLHTNAAAIWEALNHARPPPPAERLVRSRALVVWRKLFQPHFLTIDDTEAEAIAMLGRGAAFATTCDALAQHYPEMDNALAMAVFLRRWIDDEMLCGYWLSATTGEPSTNPQLSPEAIASPTCTCGQKQFSVPPVRKPDR